MGAFMGRTQPRRRAIADDRPARRPGEWKKHMDRVDETSRQGIVHDFPAGGWRFKEPAAGIYATFVNGWMLMKEGAHTGNLPGRVLRNSRYQATHG